MDKEIEEGPRAVEDLMAPTVGTKGLDEGISYGNGQEGINNVIQN